MQEVLTSRSNSYANSFGLQWNLFPEIQVDSLSRHGESRTRFFNETGWTLDELKYKLVLDAGCGAGRFAEIALECGAQVVAVDISEAVTACRRTLARFPSAQYQVLRADIFNLPFAPRSFDYIYTLGVLHHTPDPLGAIRLLTRYLKPGGQMATWIYETHPLDQFKPRTWIRSLVQSWPDERKLALARKLTGLGFPLGWCLSWLGRTGEKISYLLPYAARHHLARGSFRQQWEWSVLDTFDWYAPRYEFPQSESDVTQAMRAAGLVKVRRLAARGMAIVGKMPA